MKSKDAKVFLEALDELEREKGISKENLEHIFDRFFRVDKARSRNMGSHGLGMPIVKNIIEVLNGDLEIKSELGKGTIVHVTLPFSLK